MFSQNVITGSSGENIRRLSAGLLQSFSQKEGRICVRLPRHKAFKLKDAEGGSLRFVFFVRPVLENASGVLQSPTILFTHDR